MAERDQDFPVEIIRSARRKKSVSAQLKQGVLVVRAPAKMKERELQGIIKNLQVRVKRKIRPNPTTDADLEKRARQLNRQYFSGRLKWHSICYVSNQNSRYGSCTPSMGTIRLSDRLSKMPDWVRDYVLMHELAHLEEANHGPKFWALCNLYPLTERARGYLMAVGMEEAMGEAL